ncbi:MAG: Spermidine/spermine N(1)-acetyltransferase [Anaerolineae bacterium]|nr:Spermidine/spermine N(1)-acetyltransferase [Anaerolineae bacterium]
MFEMEQIVGQKEAVVRFVTREDLPQVAQIARITWDQTYTDTIAPENRYEFLERAYKVENLEDSIDAPGHWFYVAEVDGRVVGFGHFLKRYHPTRARAELVRLYVLPDYQNLFIGKTILKHGFKALAQAGIEQCFVSVQSSNAAARRFYERHGFTFKGSHGQFLGTQIIVLVEYVRPITPADLAE